MVFGKKGYSLTELLTVVVIIAVISVAVVPSFRKSREISKNDAARAVLVEVANAAQMYNSEVRAPQKKVAGTFGTPLSDEFDDPFLLFLQSPSLQGRAYAYLRNVENWKCPPMAQGGCDSSKGGWDLRFNGYKYFVCNPNGGSQPSLGCASDRLAAMTLPGATGRFANNKFAWVSTNGSVGHNYDMSAAVEVR